MAGARRPSAGTAARGTDGIVVVTLDDPARSANT